MFENASQHQAATRLIESGPIEPTVTFTHQIAQLQAKNNPRQTDNQVLRILGYSKHSRFFYTVLMWIFAIIIA
ncbi:MAG: hypothetical protein R3F53_30285 [Gammaproteobacteria bacterium]